MIEVYYYIPVNNAEIAVECGIKLSDWYDKTVVIDGDSKRCISALLNPRDDYEKYISPDYKCLKMELMPKYCYIADSLLYKIGKSHSEVMETYTGSIIPVENYNFGLYRLPECLVTCTVIGDFVSVLDKRLDSPILYNNSEELYIGNISEGLKEKYDDFNDVMLYYFYCKLVEDGKMAKIEDSSNGFAVFTDNRDGKVFTIKIPDISKY